MVKNKEEDKPEVYPFLAPHVKVGTIVAVPYDIEQSEKTFQAKSGHPKFSEEEFYGPVTSMNGPYVKVMLHLPSGMQEEIEYDVNFGYDLNNALCVKQIGVSINKGSYRRETPPIHQSIPEGELPPFDDEDEVEYR